MGLVLPRVSSQKYTLFQKQLMNSIDVLDGMSTVYPVAAPMEHPQYSNVAFTLIALAMEKVTGKNYSEAIDAFVSGPLNMLNTYPSPGDDSKAVIPPMDNSWGANYGLNAP